MGESVLSQAITDNVFPWKSGFQVNVIVIMPASESALPLLCSAFLEIVAVI